MIKKNITYFEYQIFKAIYSNITFEIHIASMFTFHAAGMSVVLIHVQLRRLAGKRYRIIAVLIN